MERTLRNLVLSSGMFWPGMNDPAKRKTIFKFLILTAVVAISAAAISSLVQGQLYLNDPLRVCINDRDTPYRLSATLELYVDGQRADIPANIGATEGDCQRTMYTLSDDGVIYAEWEEPYPFEIGHFLWMWDFPLKDMDESQSRILINGDESPGFISTPFIDGATYRAEFTSKAYDESKDSDFLPPDV